MKYEKDDLSWLHKRPKTSPDDGGEDSSLSVSVISARIRPPPLLGLLKQEAEADGGLLASGSISEELLDPKHQSRKSSEATIGNNPTFEAHCISPYRFLSQAGGSSRRRTQHDTVALPLPLPLPLAQTSISSGSSARSAGGDAWASLSRGSARDNPAFAEEEEEGEGEGEGEGQGEGERVEEPTLVSALMRLRLALGKPEDRDQAATKPLTSTAHVKHDM